MALALGYYKMAFNETEGKDRNFKWGNLKIYICLRGHWVLETASGTKMHFKDMHACIDGVRKGFNLKCPFFIISISGVEFRYDCREKLADSFIKFVDLDEHFLRRLIMDDIPVIYKRPKGGISFQGTRYSKKQANSSELNLICGDTIHCLYMNKKGLQSKMCKKALDNKKYVLFQNWRGTSGNFKCKEVPNIFKYKDACAFLKSIVYDFLFKK